MKLIKGENLTPEQIREVFAAFVYRYTAIPSYYPDEIAWLKEHAFYIRKDGHLSMRHKWCEPHYMGA